MFREIFFAKPYLAWMQKMSIDKINRN